MSEVFISYVREDEPVVRHICRILTANGIKVWLDKEQLEPGVRWKTAIENAIKRGLFFLSIHSRARQNRQESHAHEELILAIEQFRKRSYGATWLIPIKIDDCEIENRPLGGGESILDLQWCDLRDWSNGISRLLIAIGVKNPVVDYRKPLGRGLPPVLEVVNGFVRYEKIFGAPELLQGMEHRVVTGWCRRMEDEEIVAYFELYAPLGSRPIDFGRFA